MSTHIQESTVKTVNCLQSTHYGHPIAHPSGWGLWWVQSVIDLCSLRSIYSILSYVGSYYNSTKVNVLLGHNFVFWHDVPHWYHYSSVIFITIALNDDFGIDHCQTQVFYQLAPYNWHSVESESNTNISFQEDVFEYALRPIVEMLVHVFCKFTVQSMFHKLTV